MAEPFLSEIRIFSYLTPPRGWNSCNGQIIQIDANSALFSLIGATYGGNGQTNFGLPDLRGRVPLHRGASFVLGSRAGEVNHTLIYTEMPVHNHFIQASTSADASAPSSSTVPGAGGAAVYGTFGSGLGMNTSILGNSGQSQPHNNMQPFLVLNICICVQGIFPSRN